MPKEAVHFGSFNQREKQKPPNLNEQISQASQLYHLPISDNSRLQYSRQHIFRLEGSLQNSPQNYTTVGFKLLNNQLRGESHSIQYSETPNTEANRFQEPFYQTSLSNQIGAVNTSHIQVDCRPLHTLTSVPSQYTQQNPYYPRVHTPSNSEIYHRIAVRRNLQANANFLHGNTNHKLNDSLLYTQLNNHKADFQPLYRICGTNTNKSQLSYPDYSRSIRWAAERGLISAAKQQQILFESSREKNSPFQLSPGF
ncbi:unnamed protein product [Trichobilharzia regenti]|nr:unnamed protein product [Trichobilharzia regenti]